LPAGAHVKQIVRLDVPFLDAERHLITVLVDEGS
jgi:16S rRNA (guanine527-N7)-methyltransferase